MPNRQTIIIDWNDLFTINNSFSKYFVDNINSWIEGLDNDEITIEFTNVNMRDYAFIQSINPDYIPQIETENGMEPFFGDDVIEQRFRENKHFRSNIKSSEGIRLFQKHAQKLCKVTDHPRHAHAKMEEENILEKLLQGSNKTFKFKPNFLSQRFAEILMPPNNGFLHYAASFFEGGKNLIKRRKRFIEKAHSLYKGERIISNEDEYGIDTHNNCGLVDLDTGQQYYVNNVFAYDENKYTTYNEGYNKQFPKKDFKDIKAPAFYYKPHGRPLGGEPQRKTYVISFHGNGDDALNDLSVIKHLYSDDQPNILSVEYPSYLHDQKPDFEQIHTIAQQALRFIEQEALKDKQGNAEIETEIIIHGSSLGCVFALELAKRREKQAQAGKTNQDPNVTYQLVLNSPFNNAKNLVEHYVPNRPKLQRMILRNAKKSGLSHILDNEARISALKETPTQILSMTGDTVTPPEMQMQLKEKAGNQDLTFIKSVEGNRHIAIHRLGTTMDRLRRASIMNHHPEFNVEPYRANDTNITVNNAQEATEVKSIISLDVSI